MSLLGYQNTSNEIMLEKYSKKYQKKEVSYMTLHLSDACYFERNKIMPEKDLSAIIQNALKQNNCAIYSFSLDSNYVSGTHNSFLNEMTTATVVLYKIDSTKQKLQILVKTIKTHEGFVLNRSKKIGTTIGTTIDSLK